MSFKENLKYELSCKGCTVKDFAKKINVNYDTILSYIDARETRPSAENAVKIAKGLNVTIVSNLVRNFVPEKSHKSIMLR